MSQDGPGSLLRLFPEPFHGQYLQTSNRVSKGKEVKIKNINYYMNRILMLVSMSGHHFPPDPCAPGLHVQGRGVCPGGRAPRPAQDCRGPQSEGPC